MGSLDQDMENLHTFQTMPGKRLSKSGILAPEAEDQHPGSEKETMEQRGHPVTSTQIEFRMQQLNSRRLLLLEIQRCKKKEVQNSEETIETTQEDCIKDSEELSELRTIQKELDELLVLKEDLDRKGKRFIDYTNKGQKDQTSYKESPRGGIYMLSFLQPNQDDAAAAQRPPDRIVPPETLGREAQLTQCPFCEEVVVTEIHSQRGSAMWIMCFLCSVMGCVAGCCLIPFYMKRLRNIHHACPQCHANIHTHEPI